MHLTCNRAAERPDTEVRTGAHRSRWRCAMDGRKSFRRGARAVELDGLENRCAFAGTVGSNPTLSAIYIFRF